MDIGVTGDSSGAVAAFDSLTAAQTRYFESLADQAETSSASVGNLNAAFEHSGVHILNHELLGMVGLGGQARATMGLMSAGLGNLAESFGTSLSALAPWLIGIGAAVMIGKKLYESYKDNAGALDEDIKLMESGIEKTTALSSSFDHYKKSVGELTPELAKLEAANRSLAEAEKVLLSIELQEKLVRLQEDQAKLAEQTNIATLADAAAAAEYDRYASGSDKAHKANENLTESTSKFDVKAKQLAATIASVQAELTILSTGQTDVKKFLDDETASADAWDASMKKITESNKAATDSFEHFIEQQDKQSRKTADVGDGKEDQKWAAMRQNAEDTFGEEMRLIDASAATFEQKEQEKEQAARAFNTRLSAIDKAQAEDAKGQLNGVQQAFASTYQSMASAAGSGFAQMIVYHKSWHDSFVNFTKDAESQFISMVATMIEKWLLFTALTGGGASVGFASAFTGYKPAASATGFDGLVDGPTPFLAGEAGQTEHVQISPLGSGSSSGGGGGSSQNTSVSVSVTAAGVVTDLTAFANMMAQKTAQAIRGQGQIQMVRGS